MKLSFCLSFSSQDQYSLKNSAMYGGIWPFLWFFSGVNFLHDISLCICCSSSPCYQWFSEEHEHGMFSLTLCFKVQLLPKWRFSQPKWKEAAYIFRCVQNKPQVWMEHVSVCLGYRCSLFKLVLSYFSRSIRVSAYQLWLPACKDLAVWHLAKHTAWNFQRWV